MDHLLEIGPNAAAAMARLRARQSVVEGEGSSVWLGEDGPTFCVASDSGTLLDFLHEEDVTESDWRNARKVRRFASEVDRREYLSARGWEGGETIDRFEGPRSDQFAFRLEAGIANSSADFSVVVEEGRPTARVVTSFPGRPRIARRIELRADEWARFREELRLIRSWTWGDYGVGALDGLSWSMQHGFPDRGTATGVNAYPPEGDRELTAEFVRLLLAVNRLAGLDLWPGFDLDLGLSDIPDPRDRTEHLILAALRAWAANVEQTGGEPGSLTERRFQDGFVPSLEAHCDVAQDVYLKASGGAPAILESWPGVGALDVQLETAPPRGLSSSGPSTPTP